MTKKPNYASLYTLRSDGRYQGYYRDEAGKRRAVYDRDPERLWLKLNTPKEPQPLLFREIATAWHDEAWDRVRSGTQSSYEAPYNKAVQRLGDRVASEITARDILNHLNVLKAQNLSKSSIKIQRTVYSLIFQAAIVNPRFEKEITSNPAINVKLPTGLPAPKSRVAPEDDVVKRIQKSAKTAYFGLFPMFLICTGFRRGEALAVKWQDINFKSNTITCSKQISTRGGVSREAPPKTDNSIRVVPLLPPLKKVLKKPPKAQPTDYVFYGSDPQKPMPLATYDRKWLHYCKDMGFVTETKEKRISKQNKEYTVSHFKPTISAHILRHGYATILFEAGVDEFTAQSLLGHADIATTMAVYTHLRNKKKEQSVDKLKSFVKNGL